MEDKEQIHQLLREEVHLMREILAIMIEEEHALFEGNTQNRKELIDKKFSLKRKLLPIKRKRVEILNAFCFDDEEKSAQMRLSFPSEEEAECEFYSLRDQFLSLSQKITAQESHNRLLVKNLKKGHPPLKENFLPEKQNQEMPKKPNITTLSLEDE